MTAEKMETEEMRFYTRTENIQKLGISRDAVMDMYKDWANTYEQEVSVKYKCHTVFIYHVITGAVSKHFVMFVFFARYG